MASKASRSASLTAYVVALDRSVVVLPGVSRLPLCDYGVPMLPDQMLHLALSELVDFRARLRGRSGRLAV